MAVSSAGAIILHQNRFLLILRDDNPAIPNPNSWSIPGGHLKKGETFATALERELQEEICMVPKNIKYLGSIKNEGGGIGKIYLAILKDSKVPKISLGNEGQRLKFFEFGEMKNLKLMETLDLYFKKYGGKFKTAVENKKSANDIKIDPKELGLKP